MSTKSKLYYLEELADYKIGDEDYDVRGWEVQDSNYIQIGTVANLLVDKDARRVVYLVVEVNTSLPIDCLEGIKVRSIDGAYEFSDNDGDHHLIVPIALAKLDKKNKKVVWEGISGETFAKTPRFSNGSTLDQDFETVVLQRDSRNGLKNQTQQYCRPSFYHNTGLNSLYPKNT